MRVLIIDTCYPEFLTHHYAASPGLDRRPYAEQWRALMDTFFGTADAYSHQLGELGHEAHEVVVNCGPGRPAGGGGHTRRTDQYDGGPTIFDRRGSGTTPPSVPRPSRARNDNPQPAASEEVEQAEAAPAPDQPETVLVFKDGHQLEVANYAIVGSTLYDLTGGRRQKIALADLDLTATAKQNDDRGVDFQVPGTSEAN